MALNDGGNREHFADGGMREPSSGKGRFDLLSPVMMIRLAQHYENGAAKYETRNWEKGLPMSRCFDSCIRHLYRWLEGDNSEDHLAAAIWNIAALMHYEKYLPEDSSFRDIDMPWRGTKPDTTHYTFPEVSGEHMYVQDSKPEYDFLGGGVDKYESFGIPREGIGHSKSDDNKG